MGGTAWVITISYSVVSAAAALLAVGLWRSTRRRRSELDLERAAEGENRWLAIVVVILLALLLGTIFLVPYGAGSQKGQQVVNVTARQFVWQLDPAVVSARKSVEFRITSEDVNHGFGVYTPHGRFLFQVQAVPGRVQRIRHTFTTPGRYQILCLEFCGVGHHLMQGSFEVRS